MPAILPAIDPNWPDSSDCAEVGVPSTRFSSPVAEHPNRAVSGVSIDWIVSAVVEVSLERVESVTRCGLLVSGMRAAERSGWSPGEVRVTEAEGIGMLVA